MITPNDPTQRDAFSHFLRRELELSPARWRLIARICAGTALVVAIGMTFQIPLPAYIAYLVFIVSQADAASTMVTAIGGVVAATLAVGISILLYVFDAGEPALRIPLLALSTFAGSFFARTSSLGPIAFLAGYILVLTQTLVDDTPALDPLVHGLLWLWLVVVLPVIVTVLINLLFGESPVALSRRRATSLFTRIAAYVENPFAESPQRLREELLALGQLKNKAFLWDKRLKVFAQEDGRLIAILLELQALAQTLPATVPLAIRRSFADTIRAAGNSFLRRREAPLPELAQQGQPLDVPMDEPTCVAMKLVLQDLLNEASGHHPPDGPPAKPPHHGLLVPDALTNRSHARFAIKVMLAVLASYATYTLLDWPGIRTAVTTCFFVSLTTFGEGLHKFTLRASGAIIGGLLAGLCIVFVLPMLTDIGELCLLIAGVSALAAWISTSSETLAYAGMQIAFAFFLGILQGYGPATDLTELRDRVVGILIGNVWVTVIFASLWPVSALDQARTVRDAALKKLAALIAKTNATTATDKMAISQDLSHADLLQARGGFEWRALGTAHPHAPRTQAIERITSIAFALLRIRDVYPTPGQAKTQDTVMAAQLTALADNHPPSSMTVLRDHTEDATLHHARLRLEKEINDAHAT